MRGSWWLLSRKLELPTSQGGWACQSPRTWQDQAPDSDPALGNALRGSPSPQSLSMSVLSECPEAAITMPTNRGGLRTTGINSLTVLKLQV